MRGMFRPTTKQRKWLYRGSAVYQIIQHPWLVAPIGFTRESAGGVTVEAKAEAESSVAAGQRTPSVSEAVAA